MLGKEAHEYAGQRSEMPSSRRSTRSYTSSLGEVKVNKDYADT